MRSGSTTLLMRWRGRRRGVSHKRRQNWRQKATRPPRASTTRSGGGGNRTRARFLSRGLAERSPQRNTHDMIEMLAAAALAPWAHPLRFAPLAGWRTGASGNVPSLYGPAPVRAPLESSAWIAKNVRYRDRATEDPPNRTLAQLPRRGVIVWAVISRAAAGTRADQAGSQASEVLPLLRGRAGRRRRVFPSRLRTAAEVQRVRPHLLWGPDPRRRHLPRRRGRSTSRTHPAQRGGPPAVTVGEVPQYTEGQSIGGSNTSRSSSSHPE